MSAGQPPKDELNQPPQRAIAANGAASHPHDDETALVRLYQQVSGESEARARCTVMFVIQDIEESTNGRYEAGQ